MKKEEKALEEKVIIPQYRIIDYKFNLGKEGNIKLWSIKMVEKN